MCLDMQTINPLTICLANQGDKLELTQLLDDCYRVNGDCTIKDVRYFSDHFKGRRAVLIARVEGQIVGSMTATLISCSADLECDDEDQLSKDLIPALCLSRAATRRNDRTRGVNSILRMYCIEAARELGLASLVGFVYQDAARTRIMAKLGYSFTPLKSLENAMILYNSQLLFAKLPLKDSAETSVRLLRDQISESKNQGNWEGISLADALIECD